MASSKLLVQAVEMCKKSPALARQMRPLMVKKRYPTKKTAILATLSDSSSTPEVGSADGASMAPGMTQPSKDLAKATGTTQLKVSGGVFSRLFSRQVSAGSALGTPDTSVGEKRVCVIGGGPSGLAVLRAFKSAQQKGAEIPEIACYEKQATSGGLWNYTHRTGLDAMGEPLHNSMYRHLWSNGPKECLEFADYSFEEHFRHPIPSFPPREVLLDYMQGRIKKSGVEPWISFNSSVRDCSFDKGSGQFRVRVNQKDGAELEEHFDWVICATGHFSTPNIPDFEGLDSFTGRVLHAHDFRDAEQFTGKDILIIGTSYSAEDIASQCYKYGVNSVKLSWRTQPMGFSWPENFRTVPLLQNVKGRTCYFKDGSSADVDAIILCTGYQHSFPFMRPDLRLQTKNRLVPDSLHEGVVWQQNPQLFYLGMQDQWLTFNMFDAQAWYARDVILGRISVPERASMEKQWAADRAAEEKIEATDEANIRFQADYVRRLIEQTDYPMFDIEGVVQTFLEWEHNKHENIMTFRDKAHRSVMTGTMAPVHHTPWLHCLDDSIEDYVHKNRKPESHIAPVVPFPDKVPDGLHGQHEEPEFNPAVHLQLESPAWLKVLMGRDGNLDVSTSFPAQEHLSNGRPFPGLAYSAPFRILSDEGVRVFRQIIAANEQYAHSFERTPKLLRGLAYRSKFMRDFLYSDFVLAHMEKMSRTPMSPHGVLMHGNQVNFGEAGPGDKMVDGWHLDSVPYVLVVSLSGPDEFQGGELEIARYSSTDEVIERLQKKEVPAGALLTDKVQQPGAGYATFIQGSQIAHGVAPVTSGSRISMVNSYSSRDVFAQDMTSYTLSSGQDPDHVHPADFARHMAWRVQGQMDHLLNGNFWGKTDQVVKVLDEASKQLNATKSLISGQTTDVKPY
eukprot:CAMPEP_0197628718 /NCGR_PEP_ID=MMETSP1338-20131121/6899_1 /TAXON_ID=43686 ORGANISM="Pelagodinium beii, Strain RCC1491" /NCGR_SAMPLE_ID=MMETSP1338 /ASSEMBLY_ACC=CAM_ASM_000754 /LENGTH=900 /DNA_ID=CAMNT_0043199711 /DNA_START=52 /DNA_END=2754 /DNA_ORIENTATION=-